MTGNGQTDRQTDRRTNAGCNLHCVYNAITAFSSEPDSAGNTELIRPILSN